MLRGSRARRVAPAARALAASGLLFALLGGCKKDKPQAPIELPPPQGSASSDELSTGLGQARALAEGLAPSSTKWTRNFIIDDHRAILTGSVTDETVALMTDDAGKTWRSLRNGRDASAVWSIGPDGSLVLAAFARGGARDATNATVESVRLLFAAPDATELTTPTPLFPTPKGPATGLLRADIALPAVISPDVAALIAEGTPRKPSVFFGSRPGIEAVPPIALPPAEKIIPVPYGRPATLLSIKGRDLMMRPFPQPGKPLDPPKKVPGVLTAQTLLIDLSAAPVCEIAEWSFQKIKQPSGKLQLLGISPTKVVTVPLPDITAPGARIGCTLDHVAVETFDPKTKATQLATCDFAGKCTFAQNAPFRIWPEQHEREIVTAYADPATVSVHSSHTADRWGLYLAQAPDSAVYERPRVIAEGTGDRGRVETGALIPFGKRLLLLLSADVTGTSRRGWFVMVSDDGGSNWNPP